MGLDDALGDLVIRNRFRRRAVKFTRRTGPLVLQLEGDDAEIRTWIKKFHAEYTGVLPINEPAPADQAPPWGVAQELLEIARRCGYDGRPAFRLPIVFPRFAAVYDAFFAWRPGQEHSDADLNDELEKRVKKAIREAKKDVLPEWRERAEQISNDPYLEKFFGGLITFVLRAFGWLRFPHIRTINWFRKKGLREQPIRTTQVLINELRRWRERKPEEKYLLLIRAMLADIDTHYGFFRRLNRARHPVILLPEVDKVPARRILRDVFLTACDDASRDLRTYPIVITTSAPDKAAQDAPVRAAELGTHIRNRFDAREAAAHIYPGMPLPGRLLRISLEGCAQGSGDQRRIRPAGPVSAAIMSVALVAAAAGSGLYSWQQFNRCGERLEWAGDDCVGASDGKDVFLPDVEGMPEIFALIAAENAHVQTARHATVALMIPMESDVAAVRQQILAEVRGAYLAQHRANRPEAAAPPIRLVLVNPGRDYRQAPRAIKLLLEQEPNLRVVTDFNLSLDATRAAMSNLANKHKIPLVAGLVTSGDFANPESAKPGEYPFPGLARVVSTAKEQATALLKSDPRLAGSETALVTDTRPNDNYNASLREAFNEARMSRKKGVGVQEMQFKSKGLETVGNLPNMFSDFARNICESNARYVYFAGRAFHLKLFIQQLAGVYCRDKPSYTVITGSDATTIASRLTDGERAMLRGDPGIGRPAVSVEYAAPAHPDAWTTEVDKVGLPGYLAEPRQAMTELRQDIVDTGLGDVNLEDGRTIIAHDVVLTAAKELAKAAAINNTELPSTAQVKESLPNLNAAYRVPGASGWICLTRAGNPYNKPVPVVRLDGGSGKVGLKAVAWPQGGPPKNNCVVPQDAS
ncbi:ABC transporter substrate-binding protein [Nonomuraea purpurea]|uniref:ABC transporter substrate-binding protein n=1 Tax=Nonomuraea purpurea TaxID=1849276 RepID=A0ABV8GT22_9ACTN